MQVLIDLLLFAWIITLQGATGSFFVHRILPSNAMPRHFHVWLSCVIGTAAFSLALFALGIQYFVTRSVLLTLLLILTVVFAAVKWKSLRVSIPQLSLNGAERLLVIVSTGVSLVGLGGALAPEVRGDAIIYHISEALLFSVNHGHVEIPGSVLTYIPQYQQLQYAMGLTLGGDTLAKLFHWWAGNLLFLGTYSFARICHAPRVAALAATALLALFPIWTYLATSCYVDLATANYTLAAIAILVLIMQLGPSIPLILCSGAMLGFAMGTKYTAIVNAALPAGVALLYVLTRSRIPAKRAALHTLLFTATGLLFFSPWLIRNYVWTGNPLAPSLMHLLGPPDVPETTLNWGDIRAGDPALLSSPLKLLAAYPAMVLAFSDYGNYLPAIAILLGCLSLILTRRTGSSPTSPIVPMLLLFLGVTLLLGVPTMAVRRDSRYVMAHMAIVSVLIVVWAQQIIPVLHLSARRVTVISSTLLGAMTIFYVTRTVASFRDLKETVLPPLTAKARADYLRSRLQDYDANHALTAAGLSADKKVYGAAYPARVHYVLMGAPITSDLQVPNTNLLTLDHLEKLRRQEVGFIFGDVSSTLLPSLRLLNHYAGKPLYEIL